MGAVAKFNFEKRMSQRKRLQDGSQYSLMPVTLQGVVLRKGDGTVERYGLACASGIEYSVIADDEWRGLLSQYAWEEVKLEGLLYHGDRTVIPQRVFPKGPSGGRRGVTELVVRKARDVLDKAAKYSDVLFLPAALIALFL
jgi:hypothetical protein